VVSVFCLSVSLKVLIILTVNPCMWLYVVWNIIFTLELFHDYVYQDMKENEAYDGRVMDLLMCMCVRCTCLCDVWS